MEARSNKHLGASAYQTPEFEEPVFTAAPVKSLLHRVAGWLTQPLFTLGFSSVGEEAVDPTEYLRELDDDAMSRRNNPYDILGYPALDD